MTEPFLKVSIRCPNCGSNSFTLPLDAHDDEVAVCSECGTELGPIGKLREAAHDAAQKVVNEKLKGVFGKRRTIKL